MQKHLFYVFQKIDFFQPWLEYYSNIQILPPVAKYSNSNFPNESQRYALLTINQSLTI